MQFFTQDELVLLAFAGVEWALSVTLGLTIGQVGLPYSVINTVVPIPLYVNLGVKTLRIFYQFATTVQNAWNDLVPEILYVRAFKFAVSREFT